VDATNIQVNVQGGEVTLEGTVSDRNQKRMAEEVAEQIQGVNDVQNRLRVKSESDSGSSSQSQSSGNGNGSSTKSSGSQQGQTTSSSSKSRANS